MKKFDGKRKNALSHGRRETPYAVEVKNLRVKYVTSDATVEAVNGLDLRLEKGKTLGLVGETGAGKTTSMLSLLNLVPDPPGVVSADKIEVNGLDVNKLTPAQLCSMRGREIAMIFQDPMTSLNPVMRVGEQIAESIMLHEDISRADAMARAREMLETVGIEAARAQDYPHQFSGGMRQRVDIAIALACRPCVLIADEPTTALDVTIQAQVLKLMSDLREQYGASMILITHDLGVVAQMCDQVAVMYAGTIVEQGTLREVFEQTKHPYTEGLFNSLPNIRKRVQALRPIAGLMPDPSNLPAGCVFAPRCPYASAACARERPQPHRFTDTHMALCCAYDDANFAIGRSR